MPFFFNRRPLLNHFFVPHEIVPLYCVVYPSVQTYPNLGEIEEMRWLNIELMDIVYTQIFSDKGGQMFKSNLQMYSFLSMNYPCIPLNIWPCWGNRLPDVHTRMTKMIVDVSIRSYFWCVCVYIYIYTDYIHIIYMHVSGLK